MTQIPGQKLHDFLEEECEIEDFTKAIGLSPLPKHAIGLFDTEKVDGSHKIYVRIDIGALEEILDGHVNSAIALRYMREMQGRLRGYAAKPNENSQEKLSGIRLWSSMSFNDAYPNGIFGAKNKEPVLPMGDLESFDAKHGQSPEYGVFATAFLNLHVSKDKWPQFCEDLVKAHEETIAAITVEKSDRIKRNLNRHRSSLEQVIAGSLEPEVAPEQRPSLAERIAEQAIKHEAGRRNDQFKQGR